MDRLHDRLGSPNTYLSTPLAGSRAGTSYETAMCSQGKMFAEATKRIARN